MTTTCAACGYANVAGAHVCAACGRALPAGRGAFVGRRRELDALNARMNDAWLGNGKVAMLVGEAGIGKTTIAQAFAAEARQRGATVLQGRCFEGDWQPPYGPWVEALGAYTRAADVKQLRRQLGPGAPPLAQLVPEVQTVLPETPPAAPLSPDQERFRLYDAITQFLLAVAQAQPLALLLDDLHWADRDSLLLLLHVTRFISHARLLIVGAYRDVDLDREHALTDVLATLRRETDYTRVTVRGFSIEETAAYLTVSADQELPQALIRALYAETDGNPFYLREVFRHLAEEGKIVRRAGRWSTDFSMNALGIPEGVREVVGRRISRLSDLTQTMLRSAAAFTGGFEFQVLPALTGLPEDTLLDSIDETLRAGLIRAIEGTPAAYDFAHAIVRHTLYDELNPDRKARLHRRIATALEQVYAGRTQRYAAELAAQYHASAGLPGAERGVAYALAAADQARAGYAHDRTVTFLRIARDLAAAGQAELRADIASRQAIAEAEALLLEQARQSVDVALAALADAGATSETVIGFLTLAARSLKDGGADPTAWEPLIERGLALVGERRDLLWARLMLLQDRVEPIANDTIYVSRWLGYDPQAVAIARAHGDEDDYARTLEPFEWRTRAETKTVVELARSWRRPAAIIRALDVVARDLIYRHGEIGEAAERLRELLATSERYGSIPGQAEALVQLVLCQAILGDLAHARQTLVQAHDTVARLGTMHRLRIVARVAVECILADYIDGDWAALAATTTQIATDPAMGRGLIGLTSASFAALTHRRAGNVAEARRFLRAVTAALEQSDPNMYIYNGSLDRAATAAWEMGAAEFAPALRRIGLELLARGREGSPFNSNALTVARMAALLGQVVEASMYFDLARSVLEAGGQRPARAIVDYDEALALIRSGATDEKRITDLLDDALAQFDALGMEPWAQRALALKEQQTTLRPAQPQADRAFPDRLTAREVEVLRLVADGRTNKEIAAELVVSVPTVQRHIANIYAKIGARGRADATAYALRHELASHKVGD